ncbi:DUF6461 domain-containing protein [Streptomyces sp. NPDC005181]|uniref:DUF6461 domain-containing protein n=1 Tax=Streptomyces sp. NPDC005181 TaxID=3156869 RepID=UPI0033B6AE32
MRQPDPDRDTAVASDRPRAGLGRGGDWTLALEFAGGVGMTPEFLETLSAGTRAVSHSSNGGKPVHLVHRFENNASGSGAVRVGLVSRGAGLTVSDHWRLPEPGNQTQARCCRTLACCLISGLWLNAPEARGQRRWVCRRRSKWVRPGPGRRGCGQ